MQAVLLDFSAGACRQSDIVAHNDQGKSVDVDATGKLTLHGVTNDVTIPLEAKLVNDTIIVTGLFDIQFADYDIEKPQAVRVLSVEDQGQMEMQLFFTKA